MNSPPIKGECSNCCQKERWLFHRLLIRGIDRRLCTSCVLRLHPSSFCPSCFHFFDHPPTAAHRFVTCSKCSSLTHLECLPSPPPPTFLCPPCSNSSFSFFPDASTPIDQHHAQVLICASKVASASANKSLALASTRAERAVRESALARKKARDALVTLHVSEEVSNSRSKKDEFNRGGHVQVPVKLHSGETRPNETAKLGIRERSGQGSRVLDVASTHVL
ncbi:hypothetical protein Fmac_024691 [Flemingia macrophylla]|uniref:Uncharacterized protein n=1 Tax=Flemingia macrophylla TaxID=520843 RepID=A0ABD1LQ30_9FABA